MNKQEFTDMMVSRTKDVAIRVIKMVNSFPNKTAYFVIGKQVLKSATSTAANYRAVLRSRSKKEFFAKLSIVIEECDETLFWLQMLEDGELIEKEKIAKLKQEVEELLKILAKARKNTNF